MVEANSAQNMKKSMTTWVMALVPVDADEATTETASTWAIGRESRVSRGCGTCCPVSFVRLLVVDIVPRRNVFFSFDMRNLLRDDHEQP